MCTSSHECLDTFVCDVRKIRYIKFCEGRESDDCVAEGMLTDLLAPSDLYDLFPCECVGAWVSFIQPRTVGKRRGEKNPP